MRRHRTKLKAVTTREAPLWNLPHFEYALAKPNLDFVLYLKPLVRDAITLCSSNQNSSDVI